MRLMVSLVLLLLFHAMLTTQQQICGLSQFFDQNKTTCQPCATTCPTVCFTATADTCFTPCPSPATTLFSLDYLKCLTQAQLLNQTFPLNFTDQTFTFPIYYKQMNVNLYSGTNSTLINVPTLNMSGGVQVMRSNVIFVDPQSSASIEMGTYQYPYKTLDIAVKEAFNNFFSNNSYNHKVMLVVEESAQIIINGKVMIDSYDLVMTTYNKVTKLINYIPKDLFTNYPSKLLPIIASKSATQTISQASSFIFAQNLSYNFERRNKISDSQSYVRREIEYYDQNDIAIHFFIIYNGSLSLQNFNFTQANSIPSTLTDAFIYIINGGLLNSFQFLNCYYAIDNVFFYTSTTANVLIQRSTFNLTFTQKYIVYFKPINSLCYSNLEGYLTIDQCTFTGQYTAFEQQMVYSQAMAPLTFTNNIFSHMAFANDIWIIRAQITGVCQNNVQSSQIRTLINNNKFSFNTRPSNKMGFLIQVESSNRPIAVQFLGNTFTNWNQSSTLFVYDSKSDQLATLDMDFNSNQLFQDGYAAFLFQIKSTYLCQVSFNKINVQQSLINRFLTINNPQGTLNVQSWTMNQSYDLLGAYQKKWFFNLENVNQATFNNTTISNSKFQLMTGIKAINVTQLIITNAAFLQNTFLKENFINIVATQQLYLENVILNGNTVSAVSQANFISMDTLYCKNFQYPLTIKNVKLMNGNQLSLLANYLVVQDTPSTAITSYQFEFIGIEASNMIVSNDNFLFLGPGIVSNLNVLFRDCYFNSNILKKYSFVKLVTPSQNITMTNITFQSNQGILLLLQPQKLNTITTTYSQYTYGTNLVFLNNSNLKDNIIDIQNRAYFKIDGLRSRFEDNLVLSKQGIIQVENANCLLDIYSLAFVNNFALYGGVFTINLNSLVRCTNCKFYNNSAGLGSIAYINNNGFINLIGGEILFNYALNYELLYITGNRKITSTIQDTAIYQNSDLSQQQKYEQIITKIKQFYPNYQDFSLLDKLLKNSKTSSIHVQKSKLLIKNAKVYNQSNFIQGVIDSDIQIVSTTFQNSHLKGFLISSLKSSLTVNDSTFADIKKHDSHQEIYIFQITEHSQVYWQNNTVTNIDTSLISSHGSNVTIKSSKIYGVSFNSSLISCRFTVLNLYLTDISNTKSISKHPIMKIVEKNTLTLESSTISNFDSRAIDIQNSIAVIQRSTLQNFLYSEVNTNEQSTGVKSLDSIIDIIGSTFSNISSLTQGGALYAHQSKGQRLAKIKKVSILQSSFLNCTSVQGGAIFADNIDINVNQSTFTYNKAAEGGAVYFSCCQDCDIKTTQYECAYNFSQNTCNFNQATSKGGCFNTDLYQVQFYETSSYMSNIALYGQNYSAYPVSTKRLELDSELKYYIASDELQFVSGQTIGEPFYFGLYDMYNQIINIENSAIGKAYPISTSLEIETQDQNISSGGVFMFTSTVFVSKPGYVGNFSFDTDSIDQTIYKKAIKADYSPIIINLKLRICTIGEQIKGTKCIKCQAQTYSLTENSEVCYTCPDHATCIEDQINPDKGYWRKSANSSQVIKCYYENACPGQTFSNCNSKDGYEGVLCHECIYDVNDTKKQFTRNKEHQCSRCPKSEENIRTYALMQVGYQAYIFFLTQSYYKNLVLEKENTVLIKTFNTYSQIITLINTFDLNWPTLISDFFEGLGAPAQVAKAIVSIDCLLRDFNVVDAETTIIVLLAITTIQPVIQFIIALIFYFFAWVCRMKQIKLKLLVTSIVIYYQSYPQIVSDTFSLFTCTTKIDGMSYLVKNTQIECFGSTHVKLILLLAIPNMVVWIFGIPTIVLICIYRRRHDLNNHDNLRAFGFWYLGLKRNVFYWELLLEYKKLLMITITVDIIGMGQSYQAFMILMILYLYFILTSNLKPYKIAYLNTVSYYAEFAQLCTFAFMMVYLRKSDNIVIDNLIFVLLIGMNSLFWARFGFYLGRFYFKTLKEAYLKIRSKLRKEPQFDSKKDQDYDKISEQSEEREKDRKRKKRRKMPTAKLYKSSTLTAKEKPRQRDSNQSLDSPQNRQIMNESRTRLDDGQQGGGRGNIMDHQNNEIRKQQKIQLNKMRQEKKRLQKRKMMVLDGPIEIKIDDYIQEEKKRLRREQKSEQEKKIEEEKIEEKMGFEEKERINIKDFNLMRDNKGHLLNDEVLDNINRLL